MERKQYDEMIQAIINQIKQEGWERNAVEFERMLAEIDSYDETYDSYSDEDLRAEYFFLKHHWEINLNSSSNDQSRLIRILKNLVQKAGKLFMSHYIVQQNAINYCNKQCIRLLQLYLHQSELENNQLKCRCDLLEKKLCELERKIELY